MDDSGNDLADSAASWAMVRDNVTGLTWEVKQNRDSVKDYANPHDADNTYFWCDTDPNTNGGVQGTCMYIDTEDFLAALNGSEFGGHTDWRLPTIKELKTLADLSGSIPAISTTYFPATAALSYYWSSTTNASLTSRVWISAAGYVSGYGEKSSSMEAPRYVRAVRGGQVPTENRFIVSGDTVHDTVTWLEWQRATADINGDGTPDPMDWQNALAYAEGLSLGGHSDWRLPDHNELNSLVDYSRDNPAIDIIAFPDTVSSYYWSSTTVVFEWTINAWSVRFGDGDCVGWKSCLDYVRTVRGGQCGASGYSVISATADAGGSLDTGTPSPQTVANGSAARFTFNADTGYHVAGVNGCGISYTNTSNTVASYPATTGIISGDCTVSATFAINQYNVSASAGANGSLAATTPTPQTVDHGATTQFIFNADTGYHVAGVSGCGISYTNTSNTVASYTATTGIITGDCTVSATFAINQYNVSASAGANGSLAATTPTPQTVDHGATTQFIFNANTGYHVAAVSGCGVSYTNTSNTVASYTATTGAITGDCTVSATFAINRYTISSSSYAHGSISPLGAVSVNHGGSLTFTITPDTNYHVDDVLVDGVSAGAVTSYTFSNVTDNHSISAGFVINNTHWLSVTTAGQGAGNVTSAPGGISCPDACDAEYDHGTIVTLTAVPGEKSTFGGWSGDCMGTDATCQVTVDQTRNVTARFNSLFPWNLYLPTIINTRKP